MAFNFGYPFNPERSTLLPGVPTNLTVVKANDASVDVSWNAPIGGDTPATDYEVFFYNEQILSSSGATLLNVLAPANVAIDYKVRSVSAEGTRSAWTDIVTYTNEVLTAPTNLRVTSATDTSITLEWDVPTISPFPIASYNIFADEVLIDSSATNSYVYNGVTPNVAIDYTVLAVDSEGGESPLSEVLTYTNAVEDKHNYLLDCRFSISTGTANMAFTDDGYTIEMLTPSTSAVTPSVRTTDPDILTSGKEYTLTLETNINTGPVIFSFYVNGAYVDNQISISNGEVWTHTYTLDDASALCFIAYDGQELFDIEVIGSLYDTADTGGVETPAGAENALTANGEQVVTSNGDTFYVKEA